MRRWLGIVLALVTAGLVVVAVRAGMPSAVGTPSAVGASTPAGDPFSGPVIIDADTHGAIVLDRSTGELIGTDNSGNVRWRDRDLATRLYISCLAQCPDAVGSGSDDDTSSVSTIWWTGSTKRVDAPGPELVLWARSPREVIVARPNGSAGYLVELRGPGGTRTQSVQGSQPQLFTSSDDKRGVLIMSTPGSAFRLLSYGASGWTSTEPKSAQATSACLDDVAEHLVLFDSRHTWIANTPGASPTPLPVTHVGRCAISRDRLMTQTFTTDTQHGARTLTRSLSTTGKLQWERTDPGIHPAQLDVSTGLVALPTNAGLLVLDAHGSTVDRVPGIADARVVAPGCLLLLGSDHRMRTTSVGMPRSASPACPLPSAQSSRPR